MKLGQQLLRLVELVLPAACPLCLDTLPDGWHEPFCGACLNGFLPLPAGRCPLCALPYKNPTGSAHLCGRCIRTTPPFSTAYCVGLYEQRLRLAVQQFKFHNRISLDRPLAKLLLRQLPKASRYDLIVPVPLHQRRLQERTYNQSLLLARELGRGLRIPVAAGLLLRNQDTEPQRQLSAKAREKNMRGVFQLQGQLSGEKILLVDDVMTTGATLSACGRELLRGGGKEVQVAVVGRAPIA